MGPLLLYLLIISTLYIYVASGNHLPISNKFGLLILIPLPFIIYWFLNNVWPLSADFKEKYYREIRNIKAFLLKRTKDRSCLGKIIHLFEKTVSLRHVKYTKNSNIISLQDLFLDEILPHDIIKFSFFDLSDKNKGAYRYYKADHIYINFEDFSDFQNTYKNEYRCTLLKKIREIEKYDFIKISDIVSITNNGEGLYILDMAIRQLGEGKIGTEDQNYVMSFYALYNFFCGSGPRKFRFSKITSPSKVDGRIQDLLKHAPNFHNPIEVVRKSFETYGLQRYTPALEDILEKHNCLNRRRGKIVAYKKVLSEISKIALESDN